jgi:hypothetical protein
MYDQTLLDDYHKALAAFRDGDSRPFEVYAAALLDAACTILDPAGVMYIGCDPQIGDAYDIVNSRVWRRLIGPARQDRLDAELIRSILRDEYGSHFGSLHTFTDDGGLQTVHTGTADDAPALTDDIARLVHERLSTSERFGETRLFITAY